MIDPVTLRQIMFALLSPDLVLGKDPPTLSLAALTHEQWQDIGATVQQHRIGPLLHKNWRDRADAALVPVALRNQWQASHRRAAMRALSYRRLLARLSALLGDQDIDFITLKGGWLAYHIYPDPALRPMRDIDILVAPHQAEAAWQCLFAAGFVPGKDDGKDIAEKMAEHRHLTPLRAPDNGPSVEIHFRLNSPDARSSGANPDADWAALLERSQCLPLDAQHLRYLSPTDNLLHLVTHATLGDHFSNGALAYQDIAALIGRCVIDWPLFWSLAAERGWTRAATLMFAATQRLHGTLPIGWPDPLPEPVPDAVVDAAFDACFAPSADKEGIGLMQDVTQANGAGSLTSLLVRRMAVPPSQAAARLGMAADDRWARFAWPIWLVDRLRTRLPGLADRQTRRAARRRASLLSWLAD